MPDRWLQVKGDPSVRAFLFQQERVDSLFDSRLDLVHDIVRRMLVQKGVFHTKIHYSSSQLSCWFARDPFCYEIFVREEVLAHGFLDRFPEASLEAREPILGETEIDGILQEFRRLRLTDKTVYLRNGSINRVNGLIGMTFSCDGSHYIDHRTFFSKLDRFETPTGG